MVEGDPIAAGGGRLTLSSDFDLQWESDPYRALVALEDEGPFGAIVAWLDLPGLDGIEVLETAYRSLPAVPRVLIVTEPDVETVLAAVNRAHVTNILVEPDADRLYRTLVQAMFHSDTIGEADTDDGADHIDLRA